jgi:Spy/CpxP family protein refolding chaperone
MNFRRKEPLVIRRNGVALLFSLALVVTSVVVAQPGGATDGDKSAADRPKSRARLVKPWSDLTTLTAEQKDQIMKIHADAVDKINEIRDKEEADIMALLTPEQHKELADMEAQRRADQKAKRLAAKEKADKPADGEPKDK